MIANPWREGTLGSRTLIAGAAALVLSALAPAWATDRLIRRFDHRHGLPVSSVFAVGQDARGFLWIGTAGGLVRYDGIAMRLWTERDLGGIVDRIATGPDGEVLFSVSEDAGLYRVAGDATEAVADGGRPLSEVRDSVFDAAGDLWLARGATVQRRAGARSGSEPTTATLSGERPYRLVATGEPGVLAVTRGGVWRVRPSGEAERLLKLPGIIDAESHPNGSLFLLRYDLETRWLLLEWSAGRLVERYRSRERAIDLVLRGEAVWASFARDLVVWRPAEGLEVLGPDDAFEGTGGPLFVDGEGSLWMGNFLGLFQFPEPDTAVWTERDGLISRHTRFLARAPEGLWVSTWSGLIRFEPRSTGAVVDRVDPTGRSPVCSDGRGRLWTLVTIDEGTARRRTGVLERTGDTTMLHDYDVDAGGTCAPSREGNPWLSVGRSLLRAPAEGGRPRRVATLPGGQETIRALLETGSGSVWAGTISGRVCHRTIAGREDWTCETLPGQPQVKGLVQTSSGTIWAATSAGLFRRTRDDWETVPGSRGLPTTWMTWISESPSGGVWITGHGFLMRVRDRPDLEVGWEVLERIGVWQGLPTSGAEGVLEEPDGTLWVATSAGLVRIAAAARSAEPEPPAVRLVEVRVDDERLPLDDEPTLPHERNRLEISFAAMSYRDPSRIRYRVRPRPGAPWNESRLPSFRFVDLPPGEYRPEVVASLDGVRWSVEPAGFAFRILAPWYLRWWAMASWSALGAIVLYGAYRARMAVMLRLERQRTRIAMDLHDELGSGLGSIRILADLAREDEIDVGERARIAGQIAEGASELAGSLGDIVWSLRRDSESVEALASQLAERGARMFPDETVEFVTEFPNSWPETPLGLAVRRNLQRIGVEALHNIAKHASASRVRLGFAGEGPRWRMWVEDDGQGLDDGGTGRPEGGLGLTSMRERAREIGAAISWSRPRGGGTRVEVRFDPRAGGRKPERRTP